MDKKLQYLTKKLIPAFIQNSHPEWEKLISGYFKYLDQSYYNKIINITDNIKPNTIFPELLSDYLENYFNNILDMDYYGLTSDNKKLFLSLSKFITGLKGNKKSFKFLFHSLTNFQFPYEGSEIEIDKVEVEYEENEDWWTPSLLNINYDGGYSYDGVIFYTNVIYKPFTYRFIVDHSTEIIDNLIESVHPAGFTYDFLTRFAYDDSISFEDILNQNTTIYYRYHSDDAIFYDGSITYDYKQIDNLEF